ncbi:GNAT family N-acetyltransferase [Maribacter algicola]|uniref:GNAT family N-acetyltransferase n=1 Tax=Meishania litoralis TaxID=3434685 RepID=A0ACC7LH09_9FLAO
MLVEFEEYLIDAIHEKYAWRICDFVVSNAERLKRYFPKTLEQNLTPDLSKYFVEKKLKQYKSQEELVFVLKEKENRTVIGLVYIKKIDWKVKEAELAYCIGYQYEGKGYMTESVRWLSDYAFTELNLRTLKLIVHKSNFGSIKVAEKCGYLWKRTLFNEHKPPNESPLDMELYERT